MTHVLCLGPGMPSFVLTCRPTSSDWQPASLSPWCCARCPGTSRRDRPRYPKRNRSIGSWWIADVPDVPPRNVIFVRDIWLINPLFDPNKKALQPMWPFWKGTNAAGTCCGVTTLQSETCVCVMSLGLCMVNPLGRLVEYFWKGTSARWFAADTNFFTTFQNHPQRR